MTRMNAIIRALEQGQTAFGTFAPAGMERRAGFPNGD